MVPPQESPTFHAVSSATPNSSVFGLPLSITSMASVTTAPSTQPPETLPRKLPSLSITRLEPTGRGAEPQVSTTVASATPLFAPVLGGFEDIVVGCERRHDVRLQFVHARMILSENRLPLFGIMRLGGLFEPFLRIPGPSAMGRKRTDQIPDCLQIVYRTQFVNVRQHRTDAAR